jgi:hypothetical protein
MAEVAEQRAVGLAHRAAHLFAVGVVGFGDVQRDEAVVVAGHDARTIFAVLEEFECQAMLRIGLARRHVEAERGQRVQQTPFRHLQPVPVEPVIRRAQIRYRARELAGPAQRVGRVGGDHPVADIFDRIVVAPPEQCALGKRMQAAPAFVIGFFEGADFRQFGYIAEQ